MDSEGSAKGTSNDGTKSIDSQLSWVKEEVNLEPTRWERFIFFYPRTALCTFLTCALLLASLNMVFPFEIQFELVMSVRSDPIVQTFDAWRVRKITAAGDILIKTNNSLPLNGIIASFVKEDVLRVRQILWLEGELLYNTELIRMNGQTVKTKSDVAAQLAKFEMADGRYSSNISLAFVRIQELSRWRESILSAFGFVYEGIGEAVTSPKHLKAIKDFESKVLAIPGYKERCQLTYSLLDGSSKCTMPRSVLQHVSEAPSRHQTLIDQGFSQWSVWHGERQSNCSTGCERGGLCGVDVAYGTQPCYSSAFLHSEGTLPTDSVITSKLGDLCSPNSSSPAGTSKFMRDLQASVAEGMKKEREYLIGKNFDCSTGNSNHMRTLFYFGWPHTKFSPETDVKDCPDCEADSRQWLAGEFQDAVVGYIKDVEDSVGGSLRIYVNWGPYWDDLFDALVWRDGLLGIGSTCAVFVFLWINTRSLFLSAFGMVEVILSIPIALAIWSMTAGIRGDIYLTGLQAMCVFIILGIGADDIFVLFDAYKQSYEMLAEGTEPIKRFAWAYRRASGAMLVTSVTTMLGMVAAGLAKLPCIQTFGFFGMLVVFFDFLLCITYFAAVMIVYERHVLPNCCAPCNFLRICFKRTFGRCSKRAKQEANVAKSPSLAKSPSNKFEIGAVERFFSTSYEGLVLKRAKFLIPFWSVVIITMGVAMSVLLRPATSAPDFFSKEHPIQKYLDVSSEEFNKKSPNHIYGIFGFADMPIDRTGVGLSEEEKVGETLYSGLLASQISSAQAQQEMLDFCLAARISPLVDAWSPELCTEEVMSDSQVRVQRHCRTGVYCFMEPMRDYVVHQLGRTFPPGPDFLEILQSRSWQVYFGNYKKVLWESGDEDYKSGCFLDGSELLYCYVTLNATMPGVARSTSGYNMLKDLYDQYQDLFSNHLKSIPFRQTSGYWNWMVTQGELARSTFVSLGGCLVLTFLILIIFTSNVLVALLCMLNIIGIVMIVAGLVSLMGWSLGVMEALGMIIIVGLSVDYSVHIMHAYNEARESSREARVLYAARTMGVSVVSGAITTFLASLFLWFAQITFFNNFGTFMAITILFSVLLTTTFLMPLCYVCGPQKSYGDVPFLAAICHKRRDHRISVHVSSKRYKTPEVQPAELEDAVTTEPDLESTVVGSTAVSPSLEGEVVGVPMGKDQLSL